MFGIGSLKVSRSGLFEGAVDFHCHILPGVDDGFGSISDSLSALSRYESLGFRKVFLTPHIMEDIPNTTEGLKDRFAELCGSYSGPIELELASENMMDSLFLSRLEEDDLLPLPGRKLLVETSYFNPPFRMDSILDSIKSKGYTPVLAHPERYMYMSEKDYRKLKDKGILFQMNWFSLSGHYGDDAKEKALELLSKGWYEMSGSDLHRLSSMEKFLNTPLKKSVLQELKKLD